MPIPFVAVGDDNPQFPTFRVAAVFGPAERRAHAGGVESAAEREFGGVYGDFPAGAGLAEMHHVKAEITVLLARHPCDDLLQLVVAGGGRLHGGPRSVSGRPPAPWRPCPACRGGTGPNRISIRARC